jgi:Mg2+ and Co2+ transporter CorA
MVKSELITRLDCRLMDLRNLITDLTTDWQLMPGDESARALRDVCDTVGNALSNLGHAAEKVRRMGDW